MQQLVFVLATLYCILNFSGPCLSMTNPSIFTEYQKNEAKSLLLDVFKAVKNAIAFYKEEYDAINFDALVDTGMCAGQLELVLKHIANGVYPNVTSDILEHIHEIISKSSELINLAKLRISQEKPLYKELKACIDPQFWKKLNYPNRLTDPSFVTKPLYDKEALHNWDHCFAEIMAENCVVSKFCKDVMYGEGYILYSLSHQLLYLEVGECSGCFKDEVLKENDLLAKEFCANLLIDAHGMVDRKFADDSEDLWMEIQAFCGFVGFQNFFRSDWLRQILQWQWPQGCWGDGLPSEGNIRKVKRDERRLTGGCLSHKTGVALAALGQYGRYLMDILYKEQMPPFNFFH